MYVKMGLIFITYMYMYSIINIDFAKYSLCIIVFVHACACILCVRGLLLHSLESVRYLEFRPFSIQASALYVNLVTLTKLTVEMFGRNVFKTW